MTQPALSMQIQELEKTLGVQLIERSRNGVILTEAGREIAGRATRILADTRDIVDFARRQGNVLSGSLHLGVIPSIAPYVLPALLPLIRDGFPDLDLHLRETMTHHLVSELLDGALDLLLLALPIQNPEIETIELFNDRFLLAMQKSRNIPGQASGDARSSAAGSPAAARGRPLSARSGAVVLQPAACRQHRYVRRFQSLDYSPDGG